MSLKPDQNRAASDFRCAARKLAALFREHQDDPGIAMPLASLAGDLEALHEQVQTAVQAIRARAQEAEEGDAAAARGPSIFDACPGCGRQRPAASPSTNLCGPCLTAR